MLEVVQQLDEKILHFIHISCGNEWLDATVPFLRNPYFWAPVYLFLLVMMWRNFGKQGLWWCIFFIVTFAFCDFVSASMIKPWVHRLRPCHNDFLSFHVRPLIACGGGYSFPSTHATNHVGFAVFMILTLRHRYKLAVPLSILWALLVCYGQMYVCAHYPSDIMGGAVFGGLIGWFFGSYFIKRYGLPGQTIADSRRRE